jgi:putative ABC transport system permease protein
MRALLTKAFADLKRRKLQTAVVFLIVLLASGTATLALTLMQQTSGPYDRAFEAQSGAHLQVYFEASRVSREQVASSGGVIGATATGGPYPIDSIHLERGSEKLETNTQVQGRDQPGGQVSQVQLVSGRWASGPGEIVLTRSFADLYRISVGDVVSDVAVASKPPLRVVGEAVSMDQGSADLSTNTFWVTEAEFPVLSSPRPGWWVGYRFPGHPDDATLSQALDRLKASLPAGAVSGSATYLLFRSVFGITNSILTNTLLAFSLFALGASAAIVVNMVTGIVLAAYREVGVLKALGSTPGQVVMVFVLQMLIPALVAAVAGAVLGTLIAQPLLQQSGHALGLPPDTTLSLVPDLVAVALGLGLVAGAAALPALRAGRLSPSRALAMGSAPVNTGGSRVRRLLGTRAPRAVALGVGEAFARPVRAGLTVLAVLLGVATVIFAVGARQSLDRVQAANTQQGTAQVLVQREQAYPDASVAATLAAQPETSRVVAQAFDDVTIQGYSEPVSTLGFRGDATQLGYLVIAGRWFQAPGEALAPKQLLDDAHLHIGDTVTATASGRSTRVTIVGESFSVNNFGHSLFMDLSTLQRLVPEDAPIFYFVVLRSGADTSAYVHRVADTAPDFITVRSTDEQPIGPVQIIDSVTAVLALVLVVIAAAGLFNTVLLSTRERLRDTAILKALGMTPGQVVAMVVATALALGVIGGILGVPAGVAIFRALLTALNVSTGNDVPQQTLDVFTPLQLLAVPVLGLLVAALAAYLPGRWSARTPVVQVLRSE